ncbi:MAG TPA: hypothetical protein DCZ63_15295 [Geobacter sp.]|nr:hypothetical protein [Geobacter sp.]
MNEEFITSQRALASVVGYTPEHLSSFKNRKIGGSYELALALHKATGIPVKLWIKGDVSELNKKLEKFFVKEMTRKINSED